MKDLIELCRNMIMIFEEEGYEESAKNFDYQLKQIIRRLNGQTNTRQLRTVGNRK
jgi:hypothetical protein